MDNIMVRKIWQENDLLEFNIVCSAKLITASQDCYIQQYDLRNVCDKMKSYVANPRQRCYIEFGNKKGNFTPAFSMEIYEIDMYGHLKIEVDVEIADNDERKHRSIFYIESELGCIENFYEHLLIISDKAIGYEINLNNYPI